METGSGVGGTQYSLSLGSSTQAISRAELKAWDCLAQGEAGWSSPVNATGRVWEEQRMLPVGVRASVSKSAFRDAGLSPLWGGMTVAV